MAAILTSAMRSRALTRTWSSTWTNLVSLRARSVSAMAAIMATTRMTAAICTGYRYSVYSRMPSALVLETWLTAACVAAGTWRKPPIST